jgi:excinuclease ABC subunit C
MIDEDQKLPQLVIIDGGKGQLSSAMKSIEKLGLNGKMAVIGIAKRLEELYYPDDSLPLYIDKKSETLKLIQKLRDEAHRFGLSFHRKLRSKSALVSELDDIKGIGEETKKEILTTYKTLSNLKNANLDELKASFGNHKACILYEFLNKEDLE